MKAKKTDEDALMECYTRIYAAAEPPAVFSELLANATIDERGMKHIPFDNYLISTKDMETIIDEVIKEYKIKPWKKQAFKNTLWLGATPRTKN